MSSKYSDCRLLCYFFVGKQERKAKKMQLSAYSDKGRLFIHRILKLSATEGSTIHSGTTNIIM